jgi:hypothetical protein
MPLPVRGHALRFYMPACPKESMEKRPTPVLDCRFELFDFACKTAV